MRLKTLQNATAEEVNSTVCHWRGGLKAGDTLARWAAWQLGVPMPLYALPWGLWGSSRSTSPEARSSNCMMMAAAVALCQVPRK